MASEAGLANAYDDALSGAPLDSQASRLTQSKQQQQMPFQRQIPCSPSKHGHKTTASCIDEYRTSDELTTEYYFKQLGCPFNSQKLKMTETNVRADNVFKVHSLLAPQDLFYTNLK